jgi:hypothetical protein
VLTPRSEPDEPRHPRSEQLEFHANGQVARLALSHGTRILTPAGELPAELVTFYESGAVCRVFPAQGRVGPLWSAEDEREFVPELRLQTPLGQLNARFISISWHASGALRSLTLWPGESVAVATPLGVVSARAGLAFREDGTLASLEPARPLCVPTPLGLMTAFDPQPIGLHGDANSLEFGPDGSVSGLITTTDSVAVDDETGGRTFQVQGASSGGSCDSCSAGEALRVRFEVGAVRVRADGLEHRYPLGAVRLVKAGPERRRLPCLA